MLWKVSITIRDEKKQTSVHGFYLEHMDFVSITQPQQDPVEYVQQYVSNLDALILGQIVAVKMSLAVDLPGGLRSAPMPDSDVEEGVVVTYITAGGHTRHRIPTVNETFVNPDGDLNFAASDVDNFVQMITHPADHVANWSIGPTDNRGDPIGGVKATAESFKRSRNA